MTGHILCNLFLFFGFFFFLGFVLGAAGIKPKSYCKWKTDFCGLAIFYFFRDFYFSVSSVFFLLLFCFVFCGFFVFYSERASLESELLTCGCCFGPSCWRCCCSCWRCCCCCIGWCCSCYWFVRLISIAFLLTREPDTGQNSKKCFKIVAQIDLVRFETLPHSEKNGYRTA